MAQTKKNKTKTESESEYVPSDDEQSHFTRATSNLDYVQLSQKRQKIEKSNKGKF